MGINRKYNSIYILLLFISCAPFVYTPPELKSVQEQELLLEYKLPVDSVWTELLTYVTRSSYGIDTIDTSSKVIEMSFTSLNFHKYIQGGFLDEGGFNGYKGDYLDFIAPTDEFKSQLDCKITIQVIEGNYGDTNLSLNVDYNLRRFKNKKRTKLINQWTFTSKEVLQLKDVENDVSFYIIPSFQIENQLKNSFQLFSK